MDGVELVVVGGVLDVDVAFDVRATGCLKAARKEKVSLSRELKRREKWVARVALTTDQRMDLQPMFRGAGWLALARPRRGEERKTKLDTYWSRCWTSTRSRRECCSGSL